MSAPTATPNVVAPADTIRSSEVRILDLESGKELQVMPLGFTPALVAFSPDSKRVAGTCHFEGRVALWDIEKNAPHPQSADENTMAVRVDQHGNIELNRFVRKLTVDWRTGKVLEDKKLKHEKGTASSGPATVGCPVKSSPQRQGLPIR